MMRIKSGIKLILAFLSLICSAGLSVGQSRPLAGVSIEVAQKKLVVADGKERHTFDLSNIVDLYQLTHGKLLFSSADITLRYLVVFVSGPSRSPIAAMSFCGAGTEGYLLWLALDNLWRVRQRQSALIESCFESAEGSYESKGDRLRALWENYRLAKNFTLEYDSRAPA